MHNRIRLLARLVPPAPPPIGQAPSNTVLPLITGATGSGKVGDVITVGTGAWDNVPAGFSYEGFRSDPVTDGGVAVTDGTAPVQDEATVAFTTSSTYTFVTGDIDSLFSWKVTAFNAFGSVTVETAILGPVTASGGSAGLADTTITAGNGGEQNITGSAVATLDFAAIQIGAADARRMITLACVSQQGSAHTHTVTLYPTAADRTAGTNGIVMADRAATGTTADTASTLYESIREAAVPTGTEVYPRVVMSVTPAAACRAALRGLTHGRGTAVATAPIKTGSGAATSLSGTLDVPANGIAVTAGAATASGTAPFVACTWTGATEWVDGFVNSALYFSTALYTNDAVADTAHPITEAWFLTSDGVTPGGANTRLLAVAYGDKL